MRHMLTVGSLASGLMLALAGVRGVMPVAAQTATTPIPQLEDRGLAPDTDRLLILDRGLDDAFARGLDDPALADPLLINDVPQEDRQADRQLEVGDDRLSTQPAPQLETGDVRQEDRIQAPGDVRQEGRSPATDDGRGATTNDPVKPYYGAPAQSSASSSSNSGHGGSGHSGGHDDGGGHH